MKEKKYVMQRNPGTYQVSRYPWPELEDFNTMLIIEGVGASTARMMAYAYARRRGWKVSGKIVNVRTLKICRVRPLEEVK